MSSDKILVAAFGVGIMGLIYWFFFGKKDEAVVAGDTLDVLVDGGYKPGSIKVKRGKTVRLVFKRVDPNSCLEEVCIPDFKIRKHLPLNKKVEVIIIPQKTGVYPVHCGMNMFHGKIIVE